MAQDAVAMMQVLLVCVLLLVLLMFVVLRAARVLGAWVRCVEGWVGAVCAQRPLKLGAGVRMCALHRLLVVVRGVR